MQQTRSADAAEALTELTFAQSRLMVAGAIVGLFTLIAAFSAAWYAKRAAEAAESTLAHAREVSAVDLRPYLYFGEAKLTKPWGRTSKLSIPIRNYGRTPGLGIRLGLTSEVVPRPIGDHSILIHISDWEQIGTMGPGALDSASITLGEFSEDAFDAISAGNSAILLFLRMEYKDRFGNPDSTEVTLFVDKESLEDGDVEVLTDWSRHNRCNSD